MEPVFKLTNAEMRLAELIWEHGTIASMELVGLARQMFGWKKSTTFSVLKTLINKGAAQNICSAVSMLRTKEQYVAGQSQTYVDEMFGGSLPLGFPGLSSFSNGEAMLVKSLDATAATYQDSNVLKRTIDGYVKSLAAYAGNEKPWGQDNIYIPADSITSRRLVLVIPTNELPESLENAITACVDSARSQGVELQVERYERKINKTDAGGESAIANAGSASSDKPEN
jgi:predicted transcriptional regulator